MEIKDIQRAFQRDAELLGDYQLFTKTELANGYCDADEAAEAARQAGNGQEATRLEKLRSSYFAALMLRYWFRIFEWIQNSASLHLEPAEFVDWLSDSLYVAFYYRAWRYEFEAEVKHGRFVAWKLDSDGNQIPNPYYYLRDPDSPDKIINRCCKSMRGRVYQYYNKDRRKIATQTGSLDQLIEELGDSALAANEQDTMPCERGVHCVVTQLLQQGEGIEALIIDGIANYDAYKQEKKIESSLHFDSEIGSYIEKKSVHVAMKFDPRKLVKHLNAINQAYIARFCADYSIPHAIGEAIYNKLKALNNPKLYRYITKALIEVRESVELLSCLT